MIVEAPTEVKKLSELVPAVYNPRIITQEAYEGLKSSISSLGLINKIVWNKRTGNIVGGHQRFKVLQEQGVEETKVKVVDLDIVQEEMLNIVLNSRFFRGKYVEEKLNPILDQQQKERPELFTAVRMNELQWFEHNSMPEVEPNLTDDEVFRKYIYIRVYNKDLQKSVVEQLKQFLSDNFDSTKVYLKKEDLDEGDR